MGPGCDPSRAVDPASMLPAVRTTYRYAGSLTTPPCSEGLSWLLMKTPVTVSLSQVQTFRALFGRNGRITHSNNGRNGRSNGHSKADPFGGF